LAEIFEYTAKITFASQNFKSQYFSKISSTILLHKNKKKIHRRTFYQKLENGGEIQDGEYRHALFKKLP
jgi:hypothetical protein